MTKDGHQATSAERARPSPSAISRRTFVKALIGTGAATAFPAVGKLAESWAAVGERGSGQGRVSQSSRKD